MLVNGKFIKDWDKDRIGIYHTPTWYRHSEMCHDMHRLQEFLIWNERFMPTALTKIKSMVFPHHGQ